jgi:hypothetical protein
MQETVSTEDACTSIRLLKRVALVDDIGCENPVFAARPAIRRRGGPPTEAIEASNKFK